MTVIAILLLLTIPNKGLLIILLLKVDSDELICNIIPLTYLTQWF